VVMHKSHLQLEGPSDFLESVSSFETDCLQSELEQPLHRIADCIEFVHTGFKR
jgi:hypothetical protein